MSRTRVVPETVTVEVPFQLMKRGGRKIIVLPERMPVERASVNGTMVKALARAFRWKRMLERGEFATLGDLAIREGIAPSYLTRLLRLTQLAPHIVEATLDGRQGQEVTLARLAEVASRDWADQDNNFPFPLIGNTG